MQLALTGRSHLRPFAAFFIRSHVLPNASSAKVGVIKQFVQRGHPTRRSTASSAQLRFDKPIQTSEMTEEHYQGLQPVKVTSNSLVTYTGDRILVGCFPRAFITEKDADGVVLGFGTSEGPVAMQDFSLGKVCQQKPR